MWFIEATKMSTNALSQLLGREDPIRLHNSLLGMHPLGLKRIEPGPSPGEQEWQDTHALAGLFDVLIVLTNPIADHFTDMPGSIIQIRSQFRFPWAAKRSQLISWSWLAYGQAKRYFFMPQPEEAVSLQPK
jgi:hypothetical protein